MTVERYDPNARYIGFGDYVGEMQPDPDGDWCQHSDYLQLKAAARAENARLRGENAVLWEGLSNARAAIAVLQNELLAKLDSCPECSSEKVVAACERCGHTWEVE